MTGLVVIVFWSLAAAAAVYGLWRGLNSHLKVYLLILMSAVYLLGVFLLYWRVHDLPPFR